MELALYISGGIVALIAILAIIYFIMHKKLAVKIYRHQLWKKLYHLAQDQDFYLLNNLVIPTETETLHIDHMLVGDKFVYIIAARYYDDNLAGDSYSSARWHVVDKSGTPIREISNPVYYNESRTMVIAKFLGWNDTKAPMFISIVAINNSTELSISDESIGDYSYLIHKKDVSKLIKKIERETNCPPFDDQSLMKIITRVHRLSEDKIQEEEQMKKVQEHKNER